MAVQDDKQGPTSKWEAQAVLGITEPSLERIWESWDCSWDRQDDNPGRGPAALPGAGLAALGQLLPPAAPCQPPAPQQGGSRDLALWQHMGLASLLKIKTGASHHRGDTWFIHV